MAVIFPGFASLLIYFQLQQRKFMNAPFSRKFFIGFIALISCQMPPCLANSVTAESIWDQANAEERARSQIPANATVTSTNCESFQVRNDLRYRCTLEYNQ
jgi:hypothetical protein